MRKLLLTATLFLTSTVKASHQAGETMAGGRSLSLPAYQTGFDYILYLFIPILIIGAATQQVLQVLAEKRYKNDAWKEPEDLLSYTATAGFLIAILLSLTSLFEWFLHTSLTNFALVMLALTLVIITLKKRKFIQEELIQS